MDMTDIDTNLKGINLLENILPKDSMLKQLGENIKKLRIEKKITQDELARLVGYTSRSTINKIEKGKIDIPQSKILEFAKIFDVSPIELMCYSDIFGGKIMKLPEDASNHVVLIMSDYGICYKYFVKIETDKLTNMISKISTQPSTKEEKKFFDKVDIE